MEGLGDINLVSRVAVLNDKRAFDALVRKYQSPVRRFFLAQTAGDGALSDDLAQDTFVKAYTHIASFRGSSSFKTWLLRIAYNVMYDYRRAHRITDDIDSVAAIMPASVSRDTPAAIGHIHRYGSAEAHRAHMHRPATHRRLFHRRDCGDNADGGWHGEVAPLAREIKTCGLFKKEWIWKTTG